MTNARNWTLSNGLRDLADDLEGQSSDQPTPAFTPPPAPPTPTPTQPWKYTLLLTEADRQAALAAEAAVVASAGIRPTKSMRAEVVRALLALAAEDPVLQMRAGRQLRAQLGQ